MGKMQHAPRRTTWTAAAMAGWVLLACGQGIHTYPRWHDGGEDAGSAADPDATPDARPADTRDLDPMTFEAADLAAGDSTPDLADAGNPSATVTVDWQGGEVVAGAGRLVIPKDVLADADEISLVQLSADGTLPGYRGAVGPVFAISKTAVFQRPARFELKLTPDASTPVSRLALAYIDAKARLWIILADSAYDPTTEVMSALINEFSSPWTIAPVLRCNAPGECGSATSCQGGVCQ